MNIKSVVEFNEFGTAIDVHALGQLRAVSVKGELRRAHDHYSSTSILIEFMGFVHDFHLPTVT